jgi:hypothetical protein
MNQFIEKEQISGLTIFNNEEEEIYEMKRQILQEYNSINRHTQDVTRPMMNMNYKALPHPLTGYTNQRLLIHYDNIKIHSREHFIHQELGNIWVSYNIEMKIINIIFDSLDTEKKRQMLNANVWFIDPNHLLIKCGWDPKIKTLKIVQSRFIVDEEALKKLINKK